jgi:hypothetical protein
MEAVMAFAAISIWGTNTLCSENLMPIRSFHLFKNVVKKSKGRKVEKSKNGGLFYSCACVSKTFVMGISCVHNFFISVTWNRALRELGEANPCTIILLCVNDCAHAYFIETKL